MYHTLFLTGIASESEHSHKLPARSEALQRLLGLSVLDWIHALLYIFTVQSAVDKLRAECEDSEKETAVT